MLQMTAAADKAKREKKEEPLDTSRMKTMAADAGSKPAEIPAATNVVN
jgi:hypothetical protein